MAFPSVGVFIAIITTFRRLDLHNSFSLSLSWWNGSWNGNFPVQIYEPIWRRAWWLRRWKVHWTMAQDARNFFFFSTRFERENFVQRHSVELTLIHRLPAQPQHFNSRKFNYSASNEKLFPFLWLPYFDDSFFALPPTRAVARWRKPDNDEINLSRCLQLSSFYLAKSVTGIDYLLRYKLAVNFNVSLMGWETSRANSWQR